MSAAILSCLSDVYLKYLIRSTTLIVRCMGCVFSLGYNFRNNFRRLPHLDKIPAFAITAPAARIIIRQGCPALYTASLKMQS